MLPAVPFDYMVSNSGTEAGSNVLQTIPKLGKVCENIGIKNFMTSKTCLSLPGSSPRLQQLPDGRAKSGTRNIRAVQRF